MAASRLKKLADIVIAAGYPIVLAQTGGPRKLLNLHTLYPQLIINHAGLSAACTNNLTWVGFVCLCAVNFRMQRVIGWEMQYANVCQCAGTSINTADLKHKSRDFWS